MSIDITKYQVIKYERLKLLCYVKYQIEPVMKNILV